LRLGFRGLCRYNVINQFPNYGGWGFGLETAVIKLFEVVLDSEVVRATMDTFIGYTLMG